jgi:hypothetical protein
MIKRILIYTIPLFLIYSCTKRKVVFDGNGNYNYELPLILKLNNKDCLFDSQTKTLKYSLSSDELNNFSPSVKFQEYSSIRFKGLSLVNNSINNFDTIELNKNYNLEVTTEGEVNLFKLIFTNIPLVQIVTLDRIRNEPKILGKIQVIYPNKASTPVKSWIGVEVRGGFTSNFNKKSYGFRLYSDKHLYSPKSLPFFDLKTNDKWALDAMFLDPSRTRSKTSFNVWKAMSSDSNKISIKSKFVEVFINSESLGLYNFNEIYTEQFLSLNAESVLYTGVSNSDITRFNELPNRQPNSRFWEEWEQKYPNPSQTISWYDFKKLNELVVSSSNNDFINQIEQHIDVDNVIDYFLFVNMINGYDNVAKNCFFLKRNQTKKFQISPWDLDATWGRYHDGGAVLDNAIVSNGLFNRFLETNAGNFKTKLKARWTSLRTSVFTYNNLTSMFDDNFTELINYNVISTENSIWGTNIDLLNEKNYIFNWINNRLVFLDNYYGNL